MADPFVAEIRIFPFNFAPRGWAFCDGQLLPLSQNTALFSLLGTTYGGDGKSNFALPDLQGRSLIAPGQGPGLSLRDLGESSGVDTVTLLESEIPSHTHQIQALDIPGTLNSPEGALWAIPRYGRATEKAYSTTAGQPVTNAAISRTGQNQPHNNLSPYLTLSFCIALQGVFPPRT
ncbi:tail fiber protein [Leifsonia kafniensis]|uniref:Tail fiber protein n=1 Tax=Leifsonia kafniensis TaxID=475957 RepID=A0ABP7KGY5_9MICO